MSEYENSGSGEQNIAQGDYAIGKQVNNNGLMIQTDGEQSPAVNAQGGVQIIYGVLFEKYEQVRDECEQSMNRHWQ